MYVVCCRTCFEQSVFETLSGAQEAFNGHVDERHEVELVRMTDGQIGSELERDGATE